MDENKELQPEETPEVLLEESPKERYVPRPWWQVAGAWVGLALFLVVLVLYYMQMFRGGK